MKKKQTFFGALCLFVARMGIAGLSPIMPGTCGTILALLMAPYLFLPLPLWARLLTLFALFVLGTFVSEQAERHLKQKDPGSIVIDEWLGMWCVLAPFAEFSNANLLIAFVLFRIADIVKPWPIRLAEKSFPGGLGIMIDDAVAALYALLALLFLLYSSFVELSFILW